MNYDNPRIAEINKTLEECFSVLSQQQITDLLIERTDLQEQEERAKEVDITSGILTHNKMLNIKKSK